VQYSKDETLQKIVPFYKCYRAYVRGKVTSFKLNDPNVNTKEKNAAKKEANAYFELAASYAKQL
jgi:aminoglycoside phosphotransferase family enzyme